MRHTLAAFVFMLAGCNELGSDGVSEAEDSTVADSGAGVAPDVAVDVMPDGDPGCAGALGCSCQGPADCESGLCVDVGHLGLTRICTAVCATAADCSAGLVCLATGAPEGQPAALCLPMDARACQPCIADSDCAAANVVVGGGACVEHPGVGRFCATACASTEDCTPGFECSAAAGSSGGVRSLCLRAEGPCTCSPLSILIGSRGACHREGACDGIHSCIVSGLTACSGEPDGDPCNGADDDCDGTTDEDPCDDGDACTIDACTGGACAAPPIDCDDGEPCTTDTCDPATGCAHAATGAPCDDGSACTTEDVCTIHGCGGKTAIPCDDSNPCTNDTCTDGACQFVANTAPCVPSDVPCGAGTCVSGACLATAGAPCDDENPCTTDSCARGICGHAPTAGPCDDGNACTSGDQCVQGACAPGGPLCQDDDPCTQDQCLAGACAHPPAEGACDSDADPCTVEACIDLACVLVTPDCDDGNPCTVDTCEADGCSHAPKMGPCDDGTSCTTNDACAAGVCAGTLLMDCDDDNPCTVDDCDATCTHTAKAGPCDLDGDACTQDACAGTSCVAGPAKPCDDGNACTTDGCSAGICFATPSSGSCDDGDACTVGDLCASAQCLGTPKTCADNDDCTTDDCSAGECVHTPNAGPCDLDEDGCTVDQCAAGTCVAGPPKVCSDANPCTSDSCLDGTCAFTASAGPCTSPDPCVAGTSCSGGQCAGGEPRICDDGNPCTTDGCDSAVPGGCTTTPAAGNCDLDGNACTADVCASGSCAAGPPLACDDGNPCTTDSCGPAGCVNFANAAPCDADGLPCSIDACSGGSCIPGNSPECDDGDPCTKDGCAAMGCTHTPEGTAPCDDGSECTTADTCSSGVCVGVSDGCDDGNSCTTDTCGAAGTCQHAPVPAGPCESDGLACTNDTCQNGACVHSDTCPDSGQCYDGHCGPTGCELKVRLGEPCDDGVWCTMGDICLSGLTCKGEPRCQCRTGATCNEQAKTCTGGTVRPDGSVCSADGDGCTSDTCMGGLCKSGAAIVCTPTTCGGTRLCKSTSTTTFGCVAGADALPEGSACDDSYFCTVDDVCNAGTCVGKSGKCKSTDECTTTMWCNEPSDQCEVGAVKSNGTACEDGDPCTENERCLAGRCDHGRTWMCPVREPVMVLSAEWVVLPDASVVSLSQVTGSPTNLFMRHVSVDGAELMQSGATPVSANYWSQSAAPVTGGGFVVARTTRTGTDPSPTTTPCFPCAGQCCGTDLKPVPDCACAPNCSLSDVFYTAPSKALRIRVELDVYRPDGTRTTLTALDYDAPDALAADGIVDVCRKPSYPTGAARIYAVPGGYRVFVQEQQDAWVAWRLDEAFGTPIREVLDPALRVASQVLPWKDGGFAFVVVEKDAGVARFSDPQLAPSPESPRPLWPAGWPTNCGFCSRRASVTPDYGFTVQSPRSGGLIHARRIDAEGNLVALEPTPWSQGPMAITGLVGGGTLLVSGLFYQVFDSAGAPVNGPRLLGSHAYDLDVYGQPTLERANAVALPGGGALVGSGQSTSSGLIRVGPDGEHAHLDSLVYMSIDAAPATPSELRMLPDGGALAMKTGRIHRFRPGVDPVDVAEPADYAADGDGARIAAIYPVELFAGTPNKSYVIGVDLYDHELQTIVKSAPVGPETPVPERPSRDVAVNGNVAVVWSQHTSDGARTVRVRCLSPGGQLLGNEAVLWDVPTTLSTPVVGVVRSLSSGGFLAFASGPTTRVWRLGSDCSATAGHWEVAVPASAGATIRVADTPEGRIGATWWSTSGAVFLDLGMVPGSPIAIPLAADTGSSNFARPEVLSGLAGDRFAVGYGLGQGDTAIPARWLRYVEPATGRLSRPMGVAPAQLASGAAGGLVAWRDRGLCPSLQKQDCSIPRGELIVREIESECPESGCPAGSCGEAFCADRTCLMPVSTSPGCTP